jgi:hypothetical protein
MFAAFAFPALLPARVGLFSVGASLGIFSYSLIG